MQDTLIEEPPSLKPPSHNASPSSPAELFWALSKLALQGFGGIFPIAQRVHG
jgi:chromate transporter